MCPAGTPGGSLLRRLSVLILAGGAVWTMVPTRAQVLVEPPNAPANAAFGDGHLTLTYGGTPIATGTVAGEGGTAVEYRPLVSEASGLVTQALKWTAGAHGRLTLDLTVTGSGEAFPVEVDRPARPETVVRYSIGPSHNLRNRGIYDRHEDWVLSVDPGSSATIAWASSSDQAATFHVQAAGSEVVVRFRPRYYQRHRGLKYFRPWTYRAWRSSVAGWTSWFAFRDEVTAKDIADTAAVVAETLAPFGYEYVQIDDGFEQNPIGVPDSWLRANQKFPDGLDGLRRSITAHHLKPGIWTNVSFAQQAYAEAHPEYFVRGPDGRPAMGNWIGYVMDGSNPATIRDLVQPVYRGLRQMGWQYFKVDALRHLRYEGYNSFSDYFARKQLDRVDVYRSLATAIRDEIGPDAFTLMCWGVRPELVGVFDGCRVGSDGFGYGGFSEYNSFNNVVWRNDPDHIELTQPDAYRAATITSLTGSVLMLTDKPAVYRTDRVEAARRTGPVLFALPGQVYDVDPSRSSRIADADDELSGSGPRPFDATQPLGTHYLYAVDVSRPFETWLVLARSGGDGAAIRFQDLGLAPDREQYVFEFWTKTLLGGFTGAFSPGAVDSRYGVQDFCIRERVSHPQVLATNRHVSCGAFDLASVAWADNTLRGESHVVGQDTYAIYLTEPAGYAFRDATAVGGQVVDSERLGALRVVRLRAAANTLVRWQIRWAASVHEP